jgi:hypothetical protein
MGAWEHGSVGENIEDRIFVCVSFFEFLNLYKICTAKTR